MTKALGFLTGVCLTVAVFTVLLDRWQDRHTGELSMAAVDADAGEPDPQTLNADSEISPPVDADVVEAAVSVPDTAASPLLQPVPEHVEQDNAPQVQPAVAQAADAPAQDADSLSPDQALPTDSGDYVTPQTHIFWSPFRSEWAAKGFARRLTNATQIPIEVVEAGSGGYRVSFAYQDESQRIEHIERIESITGLQLE